MLEAQRTDADLKRGRRIDLSSAVGLIRVDEAIEQGIRSSKSRSREHVRLMGYNAKRLCAWLTQHYPSVTFWHELRPSMVVRLIDEQLRKKRAPQTINLLVNPLRLANAYVQMVDPDSYRPLVIRHPRLSKKAVVKRYLERDAMLKLLADVRARGLVNAELVVLLSGFAGLRVSESVRLERGDVNGALNTIATGTKTAYSPRVIPAPAWVVSRVLEIAPAGTGPMVRLADGRVIEDPKDFGHYFLQERLNAVSGVDGRRVTARNLRTSFANMAVAAGVPTGELQAYMGQRPSTVLAQHYGDYGRVALLRERVVDAIEAHFAAPAAVVRDVPVRKEA